jgi:hypothetical protein
MGDDVRVTADMTGVPVDITDKDLAAWKALCEAATPGPWQRSGFSLKIADGWFWIDYRPPHAPPYPRVTLVDDADLMAAARTALPALINHVLGLRKANALLLKGMESQAELMDDLKQEARRLRAALERIREWDCLNPPDPGLCHDHPWLKRTVDDALAGKPYDVLTPRAALGGPPTGAGEG